MFDEKTTIVPLAVGAAICLAGYVLEKVRRAGLFQVILFDWKPLPSGRTVMFKPFRGSYQKISQSWAQIMPLTDGHPGCPSETWGLYFDDPNTVEPAKCRYSLGVVMNGSATSELESVLAKNGFVKVENIDEPRPFLHTSFPFNGMLSILFLVMRVYPTFNLEAKKRNLDRDEDGMMVEVTRTREGVLEIFNVNTKCEALLKARP